MVDKTVKKVNAQYSPQGEMEQKYLVSGRTMSMRLWENEQPHEGKPIVERDYETVGFVLKGRAELYLEGQKIILEPGDSWLVPESARHTYKIIEPFTAVEVTSPPARMNERDQV